MWSLYIIYLLITVELTQKLSTCSWFSFNSSSFGEDTWCWFNCMSPRSCLSFFSTTNLHIRTSIWASKSRQFSQWTAVIHHLIWSNKWLTIFNKYPLLFSFGFRAFSFFPIDIISVTLYRYLCNAESAYVMIGKNWKTILSIVVGRF